MPFPPTKLWFTKKPKSISKTQSKNMVYNIIGLDIPLDTRHELNVYKIFMNVLCTFNLGPVSREERVKVRTWLA